MADRARRCARSPTPRSTRSGRTGWSACAASSTRACSTAMASPVEDALLAQGERRPERDGPGARGRGRGGPDRRRRGREHRAVRERRRPLAEPARVPRVRGRLGAPRDRRRAAPGDEGEPLRGQRAREGAGRARAHGVAPGPLVLPRRRRPALHHVVPARSDRCRRPARCGTRAARTAGTRCTGRTCS